MNNIECAINTHWRGKPSSGDDGLYYNGKKVNLGYGWLNVSDTYENIFRMIAIEGYAICPVLKGENGHRSESEFDYSWLALVDIDGGMTLDDLYEDKLYLEYGSGFYTTPSHTEANPKFRIIFQLEDPIESVGEMRSLYNALIRWYGGDGACKDAARLFFGSFNAVEFKCEKGVMPIRFAKKLIVEQDYFEQSQRPVLNNAIQFQAPSDKEKSTVLRLLSLCNIQDYHKWRNIGWAMKANGYGYDDFLWLSQTISRNVRKPFSKRLVDMIWNDGDAYALSYGHLINVIKADLGEEVVKKIPRSDILRGIS